MAKEASLCLLFLSFFIICCSGTVVGFSFRERGDTAFSTSAGTTFLKKNKISQSQIRFFVTDHKILSTLTNSDVSVDLFLNKIRVENLVSSKSSGVSWLNAHLVNILPQVHIRSIIVSCGRECLGQNETTLLLSILESMHSILSKHQISREVKVSVAFPLSFLENLNASYENDLLRILWFMKKINSFIMMEDSMDGELSMGDHFVQSVIKRATLAASILPCKDVPVVLTIKGSVIPSSMELAQFSEAVSKYIEARSHITKRIVALYVEVHTTEYFVQNELKIEEEEIFPLSYRENLSKVHIRRTLDETNNSPPINPTSDTPVVTPPDTPTIIAVPSTNPVTVSPTNPAATPMTVPSTTPVSSTPTNPTNSPVPVTNPVTTPITVPGAQPVTSYPPPSGSVPVTTPPPNTTAQAIPGQSWCVAKTGVPETTLQSALDYACGMAGVDCSQIQQGGNCYNPNSIQNHASFAFNSYYQKNPAPTSCDFGGAATIVNTNPSSGSCIYPSSSSSGAGTSG
ncbi:glucan endo-1,3-beta-glucosidase 3-like [Gastrolobium bilobum]|uniref:glucan endo-1,3-beta-glucosidase 3-like n=1 Tax=Gastrolobium bilobum TaxID=150636 RepID=UPI002AB25F37|nr:glucan endo-1,3-beta-glucosidase 3-like [Gastrolobium bilobum]